mgnify:CR=1 FL=1
MPLPKEDRYTLADVLTWDEQERIELIDGAPVMMAPPSRAHQKISGELGRQLGNYLDGKKCEVYAAPFAVRLFERADDRPEDVDTLVEPDLSVVCDPGKLDDIGCKGAPDLIIEVLSPSTQRHDRLTKYNLYERAGVPEYWIVSPNEKAVQVFLLDGGLMQPHEVYGKEDIAKVNVLEGCFIELSKLFSE